jgi:orotidine-5'-phosphate decarboxylase
MSHDPRIIVALDYPQARPALDLAAGLDPARVRLKVGKELFTAAGPAVVERLQALGFQIFLDLKFHDIPNTVAAACRAAAEMGVWLINVHASGGRAMMEAARAALDGGNVRPRLIAVTVLTSLDDAALHEAGSRWTAAEGVQQLAALAQSCGLDGVVCSPQEAAVLRAQAGPEFLLVTPGIRPAGAAAGDQKRIQTPAAALRAGASHLVIGRPITQATDPMAALAAIESEIAAA